MEADDPAAPQAARATRTEAYELAYREGKAAVADQAATLRETRDRAGTVASTAAAIAGIGASLILTQAHGSPLTALGWVGTAVAAASFGGVVLATVMVWRPVLVVFNLDPGIIVGSYVEGEPAADLAEVYRELALHLGQHIRHNRDQISNRISYFTYALWALLGLIAGLGMIVMDGRT